MPDDQASYPATVGQLSVWRDLEKVSADQHWEANIPFIWDLPPGHSVDEVWDALGALAMRHESLRTVYCVDDNGRLRQRIVVNTVDEALAPVRQGTVEVSQRAELEKEKVREAIDVTAELPWRVWVLTSAEGAPEQLFVIVHHMAADGMGAVIMQRDFRKILAGEPLAPASGPREIGLNQQNGAGARGLAVAQRYWSRTMESAPHRDLSQLPASRVGATLQTGIPMPLAHAGATEMGISLATLLLAGYYRGVREAFGDSRVLLFSMTNNRFDPAMAEVVTSLVQWVPMVIDIAEDEPLADMAQKLHWKSFNAIKHGVCDPDVIRQVRTGHEAMDPPIDPGFYYNPMLAPPGFPSEDEMVPPRIVWSEPKETVVPGIYLIIRGLTSVNVIMRASRPGSDQDKLTICLNSIQDALESAVRITAS